jgi:iron complex transport system ATP-binding protein
MLAVERVRFGYGRGPLVLDDVSFALDAGDVLWLLGPNGSGKTTLLRCVLGLHSPTAGAIRIGGRDVSALEPAELARAMAYVPQSSPAVFPFAAFDVVLMGRSPYLRFMASPTSADRALTRAAMIELGIEDLAERRFDELSGGERQMVLIARALAQGSRLLVMDEPCAGLDYGNQVRILTTIRTLARQGYGIVLSSHVADHALLIGNRVALLRGGRLRGPGSPREVITAAALSELYGTPIAVVDVAAGNDGMTEMSLCVPLVTDRQEVLR